MDRVPDSRLLGGVGTMDTLEETGRSGVVIPEQYIAPYLISNAVSVGLFVVAIVSFGISV